LIFRQKKSPVSQAGLFYQQKKKFRGFFSVAFLAASSELEKNFCNNVLQSLHQGQSISI